MKTITEEMRNKLRSPLPSEAISPHPTKKFLSTIKAIYVVERLNDVFGVGNWKTKTEVITTERVANKNPMVIVKSILTVNDYDIEIEAFGGNDNADLGDAYKGAATDALTKIGSYLEIGIDVFKGLADNNINQTKTQSYQVKKEIAQSDKEIIAQLLKDINPNLISKDDYIKECKEKTGMDLEEKNYKNIIKMLNIIKK